MVLFGANLAASFVIISAEGIRRVVVNFFTELKKIVEIISFVTIKVSDFFHYVVNVINNVNIMQLTTV
jgi:hypothetical protein